MLKKLLFILSVASLMSADSFHWQVDMHIKPGHDALSKRFSIFVNGKSSKCDCGQNPVYLVFYYGIPKVYCLRCLPIKNHKDEVDFQELLAKGMKDEQAAK